MMRFEASGWAAAAPGHGQLALGTKKVVQTWRPAPLSLPQRHLAMAWRRRQAMGTLSNWERPVNGNAIPLNGSAQKLGTPFH